MQIVSSITNEPRQKFNLSVEGGGVVRIYLYYYTTQYSWYFDFEYDNYVCKGNKVVLSLNTLRHLRNKIPFGIGFLAGSNAEPFSIDDFITGRVVMTLLNSSDVEQFEEVYEQV